VITHVDRLPDGCYNIVLRGMERFRIVGEEQEGAYRRATVEPLRDAALAPEDRAAVRRYRAKLETLVGPVGERTGADVKIPSAMGDEDLVNALAQYLDLEPIEKQALLEKHCLRTRAESLVELLEMKILMARAPRTPHLAH
jgi:Lon protease-like protein